MGGERQTPAPVALMCRAGMSDAGPRPNMQTKAGGGNGGGSSPREQGRHLLSLISLILSLFPHQLIDTDEGDRFFWFWFFWVFLLVGTPRGSAHSHEVNEGAPERSPGVTERKQRRTNAQLVVTSAASAVALPLITGSARKPSEATWGRRSKWPRLFLLLLLLLLFVLPNNHPPSPSRLSEARAAAGR